MTSKLLELPASRAHLHKLATKGLLDAEGLQPSLEAAGYIPTRRDWVKFIDTLLAFLGSALVLAGIIFFFAYNWADMGKFTKFGLIVCAIVLAVVIVKLDENWVGRFERIHDANTPLYRRKIS